MNIQNFKKLQSFVIFLVLISFMLAGTFPIQANTLYLSQKGDIVINEISWAGSSLSSSDEWIELYNTTDSEIDLTGFTLYGAGNGSPGIKLAGKIEAKDFYLISNYTYTNTNSSSILQVVPDLVTTDVSISNTSFDIQLRFRNSLGETLIDQVNTGGKAPFAGINNTQGAIRASMAKVDPVFDGNDSASWKSSENRINIKKFKAVNSICSLDYATPKAANFRSSINEKIIEIEDLCFDKGNIKNEGENTYLELSGKLDNYQGISIENSFENTNSKYEIELVSKFTQSLNLNTNIGSFKLSFGDQIAANIDRISSDYLLNNNSLFLRFAKPASLTSGNISLVVNLNPDQSILLDKVVIRKLPDEVQDLNLDARNLYSFASQNVFDSSINKDVKFLLKDDIQNENVVENNFFTTSLSFTENISYKAIYRIKFNKFNMQIYPTDIIATIVVKNQFTNSVFKKDIRKNNAIEGEYQNFSFSFVSERVGNYSFELISYGKSDVYLDSITTQRITQPEEEIIHVLDLVSGNADFKFDSINQIVQFDKTQNEPGKLLSLEPSYYCLKAEACRMRFQIKISDEANITPDTRLFSIGALSVGTNGVRNFRIKHLRKDDFVSSDFSDFTIDLPMESLSKVSLNMISYNRVSAEIRDISMTPAKREVGSNPMELQSANRINWTESQILKTSHDDNGYQGKLIDVVKTNEKLKPGNYSISFDLVKLEDFNTSSELIRVCGYNDRGTRLFDQTVEENDLEFDKLTNFKKEFSVNTESKVYIYVKFYGNQFGGFADLKVGKLVIENSKH